MYKHLRGNVKSGFDEDRFVSCNGSTTSRSEVLEGGGRGGHFGAWHHMHHTEASLTCHLTHFLAESHTRFLEEELARRYREAAPHTLSLLQVCGAYAGSMCVRSFYTLGSAMMVMVPLVCCVDELW